MTNVEFANKLDRLDPGSTLGVERFALGALFGEDIDSERTLHALEAFAVEHRCSFGWDDASRNVGRFEKNDVF
jgi:hypothetical protein